MKKKFTILLVATTLILSGCGSSNSSTETPNNSDPKNTVKPSTDNSENIAPENDKEPTDSLSLVDFEETTVIDNDECTIKITSLDPDNMWGFTLKTNLENKSSDKTYMFSVSNASINGVQTDPLFATEVAAGKKATNDLNFSDSTFAENNITEFTDIEISFRVYDSNDWTADNVAQETIHIYPYGEENASAFVRESQATDNVIVDNEYAKVTVINYKNDDIWGYTANLFFENKSDTEIMFSIDEASVNGYMADPFFATSVAPGKCSFKSVSWSNSLLEENGITEVEEIEFLFKAYDSTTFGLDDFFNDTITLNP